MSALNGTVLLLYSKGIPIAMQKGISIALDKDLPDATNKESLGWANHIIGLINAKIDFNALFDPGNPSSTPPVYMSAKALMDNILASESLLISILGLGFPIVGKADLSSLAFDAPGEQAISLAGSLKVNGQLYALANIGGLPNQLLTDPSGIGGSYDTFTCLGTAITSAINIGGGAYELSNIFAVTNLSTYKVITFLTMNSGELPTISFNDAGSGDKSNAVVMANGLNIITLIATASGNWSLFFQNTNPSDFSTSPIYVFKV